MAVTVQSPGVEWGKWHQNQPQYQSFYYGVGVPNAVRPQAYDSRTNSTDGFGRSNVSWYSTSVDYTQTPQTNPNGQIYNQQYSYVPPHQDLLSNSMVASVPCNYVQSQVPQHLPPPPNQPLLQFTVPDGSPQGRLDTAVKRERQFANVKSEAQGLSYNTQHWTTSPPPTAHPKEHPGATSSSETNGTDVDKLMKAIQTGAQISAPSRPSSPAEVRSVDDTSPDKKRYKCNFPGCDRSFQQKTHMSLHYRAHTGAKPYACQAPGCHQRFSQRGNLRTHERRHTGERPYQCSICGKQFAQKGNVRAHKIVHEKAKPFTCKLDNCGKNFSQLGNLKSHHNRFHTNTIRALTSKFSVHGSSTASSEDREMWDYFANLYKYANKGIKGRGKDRKVEPVFSTNSSASVGFPNSRPEDTRNHDRHLVGTLSFSDTTMDRRRESMVGGYDNYDEAPSSNASQYGGSSNTSLYGVDVGIDRLKLDRGDRAAAFGMRPSYTM